MAKAELSSFVSCPQPSLPILTGTEISLTMEDYFSEYFMVFKIIMMLLLKNKTTLQWENQNMKHFPFKINLFPNILV